MAKGLDRIVDWYCRSVSGVLLVAGTAKLVTTLGHAQILRFNDPVFSQPIRQVLAMAALIELVCVIFIFWQRHPVPRLLAIAWLGSGFLLYRFFLHVLKAPKPCSCLGNLGDWLHIAPSNIALLLLVLNCYMFLGALILLVAIARADREQRGMSMTVGGIAA